MSFSTWLKERRLARVHAKLKHLRAFQGRIREQLEDVHARQKRGEASTELAAREQKLVAEKEKLTREISTLAHEEKELQAQLKGLEGGAALS